MSETVIITVEDELDEWDLKIIQEALRKEHFLVLSVKKEKK